MTSYRKFRSWRLEQKEQRLLRKQEQIGKKYNVIKNVSTHSMLNDPDGEIDISGDLEDIGMCLNKSLDNNIHMVEKTTQTEKFHELGHVTPNGTAPCNHPSMSCQELLDLSKGNSSSASSQVRNNRFCAPILYCTPYCTFLYFTVLYCTLLYTCTVLYFSQILFDFTRYNYCSTYNLAEGVDSKKKQKAVYSMYSDLTVITPTKKKPVLR